MYSNSSYSLFPKIHLIHYFGHISWRWNRNFDPKMGLNAQILSSFETPWLFGSGRIECIKLIIMSSRSKPWSPPKMATNANTYCNYSYTMASRIAWQLELNIKVDWTFVGPIIAWNVIQIIGLRKFFYQGVLSYTPLKSSVEYLWEISKIYSPKI